MIKKRVYNLYNVEVEQQSYSLLFKIIILSSISAAEGWESDPLNIACSSGFLTIINAQYYAPSNLFCSWYDEAKAVAQSKCNNKASCSISTVPGEFFW